MYTSTPRTSSNGTIEPFTTTNESLQPAAAALLNLREKFDEHRSYASDSNDTSADTIPPQTINQQNEMTLDSTEFCTVATPPQTMDREDGKILHSTNIPADSIYLQKINQPDSDILHCFTLFPLLPLELRLMIFELIPRPRKIIIQAIDPLKQKTSGYLGNKTLVLIATPYTPRLFHVNQESRDLMKKSYRIEFQVGARRPIYYDPNHDVITSKDASPIQDLCRNFIWENDRPHTQNDVSFGIFALKISSDVRHCDENEGEYIGSNPGYMMLFGSQNLASTFCLPGDIVKTFVFVHLEWDAEFAAKERSDFYEHLKTQDQRRLGLLSSIRGHELELYHFPKVIHMKLEDFEAQFNF